VGHRPVEGLGRQHDRLTGLDAAQVRRSERQVQVVGQMLQRPPTIGERQRAKVPAATLVHVRQDQRRGRSFGQRRHQRLRRMQAAPHRAEIESLRSDHDEAAPHDRLVECEPGQRVDHLGEVPIEASTTVGYEAVHAGAQARGHAQAVPVRLESPIGTVRDAVDDLDRRTRLGYRDDVARDVDHRLPPLAPHAPTLAPRRACSHREHDRDVLRRWSELGVVRLSSPE
jgi:hypothetical protein